MVIYHYDLRSTELRLQHYRMAFVFDIVDLCETGNFLSSLLSLEIIDPVHLEYMGSPMPKVILLASSQLPGIQILTQLLSKYRGS